MPSRSRNSIPLGGAALLILVCLVWGGNMVSIKFSNQGVPPMMAATIRSAVAASLLWFWMIHTYPVSRLAAFIFLAPLFGVLLGGILQGNPLPLQLWLGLGCVAGGIYLVNRPQPA